MAFPHNLLTNIHSINLPYCRWALFQLEGPDLLSSGSQGDNNILRIEPAEVAACALRRNAFLVTCKRDTGGFWLFDASGSGPPSLDSQHAKIADVIGHPRFKFVQGGVLSSRQLRPASREPTIIVDPSTGQRPNPESPQTQSALFQPIGGNGDVLMLVHRAFITSLMSSILYSIVKDGDWLEFGNDSCLRVSEDLTSIMMPDSAGPQELTITVEQLILDVRWSPAGIVTLGCRSTRLPGFSQLSKVLDHGSAVDRGFPEVGDHVFISPFGTHCRVLGTEKQVSGALKADGRDRRFTKAWLDSRGLGSKADSEWIYLQVYDQTVSSEVSRDPRDACQIWWPAQLSFIKHAFIDRDTKTAMDRIVDESFVDPLEKAERWFLGRAGRQQITESRKRESDESKLQGSLSSDLEDNETDEFTDDCVARTDQYLNAQEASSIYPTPPDGLVFHTQSSIASHDTPGASTSEVHATPAIINGTTGVQISSLDPTGIAIPGGQLTKNESQDLFENMDTGMFDTNGLTEADFNFFDEPDVEEGSVDIIHDDAAVLEVESLGVAGELVGRGVLEFNQTTDQDLPAASQRYMTLAHHESHSPTTMPVTSATTPCLSDGTLAQQRVSGSDPLSRPKQLEQSRVTDHNGKRSSFDLIALRNHAPGFDEKYRHAGKYATSSPEAQSGLKPNGVSSAQERELPKIGHLLETSDDSSDETDNGESNQHFDLDVKDGVLAPVSELAAVDMGRNRGHRYSRKRKRESGIENHFPATPADSVNSVQADPELPTGLHTCLYQNYSEQRSLRDVISALDVRPTDVSLAYHGNDRDFIQTAQLVADQTTMQAGVFALLPTSFWQKPRLSDAPTSCPDLVHEILSGILPNSSQCDLKSYVGLDLNVAISLSQKTVSLQDDIERRRQAVFQSRGNKNPIETISEILTPYLKVQRGQDAIDIASHALYFWEELGLAPSQQKKDVEAFCIYPDNGTIRSAASTFMTTLQNSYQSCKFGIHQSASEHSTYQEGLVPVSVTSSDANAFANILNSVCEKLGSDIALNEPEGTNIVIYIVDPFNNDIMLSHLCAAFLKLSTAYATGAKQAGKSSTRDIVLQIVPLNFLAHCDCLVIPPPKAYTKLAFEVYSRCCPAPCSDGTMPSPFTSGSAIRLAKPIPKNVSFQISMQPPVGLLSSDPSLHLAYSWDFNQQWLACAWIDNLGLTQWNAAYCLGDPESDHWAAFAETVKEILDTTKDMLQPSNLPWRLYVVKDNGMYQQELEVWRLHSASVFRQQTKIIVLSIDTNPPLAFRNGQANFDEQIPYSTLDTPPAAFTPNEQILSPDHFSPTVTHAPSHLTQNSPATPITPSFPDNDPSALLIDAVSKTWIILSPAPITDPYLGPAHLASISASGYLLKRAGAKDEDGLLPLGVNLITTIVSRPETGNCQADAKTLGELLGMYGGLAALARLRGLEDWKTGILPWHMAAARKARKAVTTCMRWG